MGTNEYHDINEIIRIMIPPRFGIRIYLVPERNALQGIEIILIKILGIIIFNRTLPSAKSFPNKNKIRSLNKNKIKHKKKENMNSMKKVFLKI